MLIRVNHQFSQEGYNVIHAVYPPPSGEPVEKIVKDAQAKILELGADWALITYGLLSKDASTLITLLALSMADLKACVHFCPSAETKKGYLVHDDEGRYIP